MIFVLIAAGIVAGLLGEIGDTIAILAIVLVNAAIGFVQEYRAERAILVLRQMAAHEARTVRDETTVVLRAEELVPGDIVLLEAGNLVPADVRIIEAEQLRVDESTLTGESLAAEKDTLPSVGSDVALGDRKSMAFKGTIVTNGRGRCIVVATGASTELGQVASLLEQHEEVKTPLQQRVERFGRILALATLAICAIVFAAGLARHEPVVPMFLTAVSLAVAAIPEALPVVVAIALALGARRMVTVNALVRHLPAVETLGSVTYICTDKTGTLTENRMTVDTVYAGGEFLGSWEDAGNGPSRELFVAMALSNDATLSPNGDSLGDATEVALLRAAAAAGHEKIALEQIMPRVAEFAFDSERRRMTTVHLRDGRMIAFVKGAPESVLPLCTEGLSENKANEATEQMAARGLRVLVMASRDLGTDKPGTAADVERSLTFLGLAGLIDPPRQGVREAVGSCKQAGIVPVMITGDHPKTARAIAEQLGICGPGDAVLTGPELASLSAQELQNRAKQVRVYARVNPGEKLRIIEALQQRGEFVAMTGDGVNDAPALKKADIGIAMGKGGTDVAREASDLILLDDNFATIVGAVKEGRHIYGNIRKFVKFVIAGNSAEVWTIFLAPFVGLPVPLLPIHILWINLVTDGLPGLALAAEAETEPLMNRPPRPPSESLVAGGLWQHILWVGLLIAGCSLLAQAMRIERPEPYWRSMVFMVLTMAQVSTLLAARSERRPSWKLGWGSPLFRSAVLLTVGLQMAAIYWPPLQRVLKTAPLAGVDLALVLGLCLAVYACIEFEKWMVRRGWLYRTGAQAA
jgi:Ca2+-transporting ATPase